MDADETVPKMNLECLPETYVIFITKNDVLKGSKPLYHIERIIKELGTDFNDGTHIIYVNGQYRGNDPIGDLMHDFSCKKSADMKNKIFAEKVRYLKEDEQGVAQMYKIMEDFAREERAEARAERNIEVAEEMLKEGSLPLEKIAQFTDLPLETVRQIAQKLAAVQR